MIRLLLCRVVWCSEAGSDSLVAIIGTVINRVLVAQVALRLTLVYRLH